MLRGTPFHQRTATYCQTQNWRRWAGFLVAGSYEMTHDREYYAIRTSAAIIDVSPLYKYVIRGRHAQQLINRVITRDVSRCRPGQVMYTPWCNEEGKVLDDGTLARLDHEVFRLTAAEPNYHWLQENAYGLDVVVEDISERLAALSVQGPLSRDLLRAAANPDLSTLAFFRVTSASINQVPVTVSRTGYTGDLGYEIWLDAANAEAVWDHLMLVGEAYGITPAGMLALDIARIEAGLVLIDVDYVPARKAKIEAQTSTPFELGLGWTVNLDKGPFNGRDALQAESKRGARWHLCGLEVDWESLEQLYAEMKLPPALPTQAWRTSVPVYRGKRQLGYATSGCWSPILKKYIALAHLEASYAKPGTEVLMEVTVEHRRRHAHARVVKTPFFNPTRKRSPV